MPDGCILVPFFREKIVIRTRRLTATRNARQHIALRERDEAKLLDSVALVVGFRAQSVGARRKL